MRRVQEGVRLRSERSDGRKILVHAIRVVWLPHAARNVTYVKVVLFQRTRFLFPMGNESLKSEKAALHYSHRNRNKGKWQR